MFDKTLYNVCMGIQVGNSKQHYELFYMNPSHSSQFDEKFCVPKGKIN